MAYAKETKVSVGQTRTEIDHLLQRHGAKSTAFMFSATRAIVVFELGNRHIKFDLPLPPVDDRKSEQKVRSLWRGLLLCIKAKLESVESRIESFDEAFLAHVVMPDGGTVYEHTRATITQVYADGQMKPLLPPPTKEHAHGKAS